MIKMRMANEKDKFYSKNWRKIENVIKKENSELVHLFQLIYMNFYFFAFPSKFEIEKKILLNFAVYFMSTLKLVKKFNLSKTCLNFYRLYSLQSIIFPLLSLSSASSSSLRLQMKSISLLLIFLYLF